MCTIFKKSSFWHIFTVFFAFLSEKKPILLFIIFKFAIDYYTYVMYNIK